MTTRSWLSSLVASKSRAPDRRHRFDWVTLGFRPGAAALATAGCILGACMPYHHPVAMGISVLWWGIFLGCFGASGALVALLSERTPISPSAGWDEEGNPPAGGGIGLPPSPHRAGRPPLDHRRIRSAFTSSDWGPP
jgi:hypothetical protein